MGCDIHAMIERRKKFPWGSSRWINAGDPDIDRNYEVFAVLANVRNDGGIPSIADPRGVPKWTEANQIDFGTEACSEFIAWHESWGRDAHSASWVTLAEMKAYDTEQTIYSARLVTSRDESGAITGTCASTNGPHLGPVGEVNVFGPWGPGAWLDLIARVEAVKGAEDTDEDVRLVFFFDN